MRKLLSIFIALLTVTVITSCSLMDAVSSAEPSRWEKEQFERSVSRSVRKAVQQPGIDNGSTLVISTKGDTLIASTDSTVTRTVYVDIQAPAYPKGISNRAMEMLTVIWVIGGVAAVILIVLISVLIYVLRRQHNRNKSINNAIEHDYQLPEAFYTGAPSAPKITINQVSPTATPAAGEGQSENTTTPPPSPEIISEAVKTVNNACRSMPAREIRNGFVLTGLGVMLFLAFAAGHNAEVGFFCGGSLFVLGIAKFIPYIFNKRF